MKKQTPNFLASTLTWLAAILFYTTGSAWASAIPAPLHPEKWSEIDRYIKTGWLEKVGTMESLPHPYAYALNPGTLYYWDIYFINEGMLKQCNNSDLKLEKQLLEQARHNVDNFTYEINKLGFIPNASGWGEDRSQTPYYAMMVRSLYDKMEQKNKAWLSECYKAALKEYSFWTNMDDNQIEDHLTPGINLAHFAHHSDTAALVTFYDRVLKGRFHLKDGATVAEKVQIAAHRMAEAETMDFTPRFDGRCMDFIAVDLNANLYQYEKNLAYFEQELGLTTHYNWEKRAAERVRLLNTYCWNEERGLFLDYDYVNKCHNRVASAATFMPLYWGFATPEQARRVRENLPLFESEGGVVVCQQSEQTILYQWGDGAVWPPIQILSIAALQRNGYTEDATRIAMKYLNTATRHYLDPAPSTYPPFKYGDGKRHPGFLYEKYTRDGLINDTEYPCSEMIAWAGAAYLFALEQVQNHHLTAIHPEKWNDVEKYIRNHWGDFVEKHPLLPKPYLFGLNPGTLYYWDLYFHNEGLMRHDQFELAQNNLDCMIYQIDSLGFIPNASGWGTDRSQTPCFSQSVRRYYEMAPTKDKEWLRKAYQAVLKEYNFWTNRNGVNIEDHSTSVPGLQRYAHHSDTAALITFYDRILKGRFNLPDGATAAEKVTIAAHRMAEAESSMDFNPRFEGRCLDYIPVCLNAYLYGYEMDLAYYEKELGIKPTAPWAKMAKQRAKLLTQYCWDEERGLFLDYDFVNGHRSPVASVSGMIPMMLGFATPAQAQRIAQNIPLFDSEGGLVTCEVTPQKIAYQWGDASVWAPIQHIAMEAMEAYGYQAEAKKIALKWLNTVTRNYVDPYPATYPPFKYGDGTREAGFLWEKYKRDGTINDNEYSCSIMMGWTASAYLRALEVMRK